MNAPAWLPAILADVMLAIAAFSIWRIAMAGVLRAPTDLAHDAAILLLALATAGMLVRWMHLLSPGAWAVLLAATGVWLAAHAVQTHRRPEEVGAVPGSPRGSLAAAAVCAIGVYMLLAGIAPSTINGSTAGYYTMAGMAGMSKDNTITYPALGVAFAVVLLGFAVAALDRLPRAPVETAPGDTGATRALAPRLFALSEVAIVVTMAYAILAKLV
jgi:hypothetical protein